jgi:DNA segregation ATPase FtsK/SpoIIIE, S-DNA-T family
LPNRISFQATSSMESKIVFDNSSAGADRLLGEGDMLFMRGGGRIERVHGGYMSSSEIRKVVAFLRERYGSKPV